MVSFYLFIFTGDSKIAIPLIIAQIRSDAEHGSAIVRIKQRIVALTSRGSASTLVRQQAALRYICNSFTLYL